MKTLALLALFFSACANFDTPFMGEIPGPLHKTGKIMTESVRFEYDYFSITQIIAVHNDTPYYFEGAVRCVWTNLYQPAMSVSEDTSRFAIDPYAVKHVVLTGFNRHSFPLQGECRLYTLKVVGKKQNI